MAIFMNRFFPSILPELHVFTHSVFIQKDFKSNFRKSDDRKSQEVRKEKTFCAGKVRMSWVADRTRSHVFFDFGQLQTSVERAQARHRMDYNSFVTSVVKDAEVEVILVP